jgi:hypothetical protein
LQLASLEDENLPLYLAELKTAFEGFVNRCLNDFLTQEMKEKDFPAVSAQDVVQLMHRLECNILPNIIPNNTRFGIPASLATILNASAMYRVHVLASTDKNVGSEDIYRDIQKLERLTAKALEVSYIQHEFNAWQPETNS